MARNRISRDAKKMQPFIAGQAGHIVNDAITSGEVTIDHGGLLGLADDDHTQYLPVSGVRGMAGSLLPGLTDTYDLGASTMLWRKAYISEIDAVVFAENTITLLGGWFMVTKDQGTLAASVAAADTTIDFGKTMTTGDFVIFRAANKVEYVQVGAFGTGTRYGVTRNLDGSGANDWPAGSPWAVLGQNGDGRIELNAYDTPRISIITQGATYNAQTEAIRIGDMVNIFGTGANHRPGIGIGDYTGGNYFSYNAEAAGGFVIKGGAGQVLLNQDGLSITAGSASTQQIKFWDGSHVFSMIYQTGNRLYLQGFQGPGVNTGGVALRSEAGGPNSDAYGELDPDIGWHVYSAFPHPNNVRYMGDLQSEKNGTFYTGYIYVPASGSSSSWNGNTRSTTAKTLIDLSTVFGLPAGIKAVDLDIFVSDSASAATNNLGIILGPTATASAGRYFFCGGMPNNFVSYQNGVITCNTNGDIYFQALASGAGTLKVWIYVNGYYI